MSGFRGRCLVSMLILAGGILLATGLYRGVPGSDAPYFPKCVVRQATGWDCAGCGMTRAMHDLLHLRFGKALAYNPLIVLALPLIVLGCGMEWAAWLYGERYRGPRVRLSMRTGVVVVVVILLYSVLRNIPVWPLTLLGPGG